MKKFDLQKLDLIFLLIILLAVVLRLIGIRYGFPFIYHPDEPVYVRIAQTIFKTGDLNPHFFNYPSLFFYLNALAYIPYFLTGKALGYFDSPVDIPEADILVMGTGIIDRPSVFLLGRLVTTLFSAAAVGLVFLSVWRLTGKKGPAYFSALFAAVNPTLINHSHYVTPDTFVVFFVLLVFYFSVRIFKTGNISDYLLAGIACGFVISTKYNGAIAAIMVISAHFLHYQKAGFREFGRLILSGITAIAGFLLTTPYAALDFQKFMADFRFEAAHYREGHPGMEGQSLVWYLQYLWNFVGIGLIFAVYAVAEGLYRKSKKTLLVSSFPVVYLLFIVQFTVRNDRTLMPALPFIGMLVMIGILRLIDATKFERGKRILLTLLLSGSLIVPLFQSVRTLENLTQPTPKTLAHDWINEHIPRGSRVVIESYSPYLDPAVYQVMALIRLSDRDTSWFANENCDYFVASSEMYDRYFRQADQYVSEHQTYVYLFKEFDLIKEFSPRGSTVRIYSCSR